MANTRAEVQTRLTLRDEASSAMRSATQSIVSDAKRIALGAAGAAVSYQAFKTAVVESISISLEHEQVLRKLEVAGIANARAVDRQAESLEFLSGISSDTIAEYVALVKQFGRTEQQSRKLVSTAIDLAAATGIDLDTAVKQLNKSYSGLIEETLAQVDGMLALSVESRKAGAAVDLAAEKFGGAASRLRTDAVKISAFREAWKDLQQQAGDTLRTIGGGGDAIDTATSNIDKLTQDIKELTEGYRVAREEKEKFDNTLVGKVLGIGDMGRNVRRGTDSFAPDAFKVSPLPGLSLQGVPIKPVLVQVQEFLGAKSLKELDERNAANTVGLAARGLDAVKSLREQTPISEKPIQGPEPESEWDAALRMASMSLEDLRAAAEESAGALRSEATMRNIREGGFFDTSGFNPFTGPGDSGFSTGQLTNPNPERRVSQIPIEELRDKYGEATDAAQELAQTNLDGTQLAAEGFADMFATIGRGTDDIERAFLRVIGNVVGALSAQQIGGTFGGPIGSAIGSIFGGLLNSEQEASPLNRETRNRAMARELAPYLREATARNQVARR